MGEIARAAVGDAISLLGLPAGVFVHVGGLVLTERQRRISVALQTAEALTGLAREDLDEQIAGRPELVPLVVRVLQAAGNTGNDRTLQALGAAVGRAVNDPPSRPHQEMLVMALDGLTDEHIAVLAVCTSDPKTTDAVVAAVDGLVDRAVVEMALMSLLPRGLFANPFGGYGGGEHWGLSELGVAVRDAAIVAFPTPIDDEAPGE